MIDTKLKLQKGKFVLIISLFIVSMFLTNLVVAQPEIDDRVKSVLEKEKEVEVVVVLKDIETSSLDSSVKEKISNNQDKVIGKIKEDVKNIHKFELTNAFYAKINQNALKKLQSDEDVKKVIYDLSDHLTLTESVNLISANDVQSLGYTGVGQTVCVIDSGINYSHTGLGGCSSAQFLGGSCPKVINGWDFFNNDNDPMDDNGHGTHVAGIVASTDSTYKGVAPDAKLVALKVCSTDGSCSISAQINALQWCRYNATKFNISVITISIGVPRNTRTIVMMTLVLVK